MDQKNTGFIEKYPEPLEFVAGKETGIVYKENLQGADWREFLPSDEKQAFAGFETAACVSFSAHNIIETQVNFMVKMGLLTGAKLEALKQMGFFDANGKFNCSDRFTAKMSGTTWKGNTLQAVWDSIRNNGLVPEAMWPAGGGSFDGYYSEIPDTIKAFGKKILDVFDFQYEWIVVGNCGQGDLPFLRNHLKQAPLQLAAPVGVKDPNGIILNPGVCTAQHATQIYAIDEYIEQFDSYDTFRKMLVLNYPMPWIMKGLVNLKAPISIPPTAPFGHVFNIKINYGELNSEETRWLQKAFLRLVQQGKFKASIGVLVTGNYADRTKQLVKEFQTQYQLATPADIEYINGRWVGAITRAKLNELTK